MDDVVAESAKSAAALGLLEHTTVIGPPLEAASPVRAVVCDSRKVAPGDLFVAVAGAAADGAQFVPDAIARGAVAILGNAAAAMQSMLHFDSLPVPFIIHAEPRRKLAEIAARYWSRQPATVVAVTGTNGKTSTVDFLRQIWLAAGLTAASIGTIGTVTAAGRSELDLTTPDPITLHAVLDGYAGEGITHVAIEASSHALDQFRIDGVRLAAAAITSLSRDHLDYHADMHAYAAAKLRLFLELLPADGCAVMNTDQAIGRITRDVARRRECRAIPVGQADTSDGIRIQDCQPIETGQRICFEYAGAEHDVVIPVAGEFQASNALVAAACAIGCGVSAANVFAALPRLESVRGRMELVARRDNGATIFVDYAHTPDALGTVLRAARRHVMGSGRLHAVFGAGGDRDVGKRKAMGIASAKYADQVIVTDDNPRDEDAAAIRSAIRVGAPDACEIGDRREAIYQAVRALAPGDVLVVAGKGHEAFQTRQGQCEPFDDAAVARAAVAAVDARA